MKIELEEKRRPWWWWTWLALALSVFSVVRCQNSEHGGWVCVYGGYPFSLKLWAQLK